jgi:3-polyprenyl-4-hydroxybenzoate decarboxylase
MTRSGHREVSPLARVVDHGEETFLLAPDGSAHALSGDSAELVRAVLSLHDRPRTREEILEALGALTGAPILDPTPVDEALALLDQCGVLSHPRDHAPPATPRRLVLGVSGAVAASGAPDLASRLYGAGFEVRVAMTRDARRFVSPLVLEAVTHQPVQRSLWSGGVPHIQLAEWAELVLICPASATTISRIAQGDCSCLVAAIAVGTRAPILLVPSMNGAMLHSPSVQRNLATLADDGFWIVRGGAGVELAHAPSERAPMAGAMPGAAAVVDLARFILLRRESPASAP